MRFHSGSAGRNVDVRAFTIVEVITVVGIIALLLALLMPVLAGMKTSSRMAVEQSSARQLMVAHSAYAQNNKDWVLPGIKSGLRAVDAAGQPISEIGPPRAADRYPWRIAPYLDFDFRGLYTNDLEQMLERLEHESYEDYVYFVSISPSLGYNTEWVGGGDVSGNEFHPGFLKTYGTPYVRRSTEVRHVDRLMVFSSSRGIDPLQLAGDQPIEGFHHLRSPYFYAADGDRWSERFRATDDPEEFGFVSPRYDDHAVSAFFDGHVDVLNTTQLRDMRYWCDKADREDWGLEPRD